MAKFAGPAPATSTGGNRALLFPHFNTTTVYDAFLGWSRGNGSTTPCNSLEEAFAVLTAAGCLVSPEDQALAARTLRTRTKVGYAFENLDPKPAYAGSKWIGGITRRQVKVNAEGKAMKLFARFPGLKSQQTGQDRFSTFYRIFVPADYVVGTGPDAHFSEADLEQAIGWDSGYFGASKRGITSTEGGTYYSYSCNKD